MAAHTFSKFKNYDGSIVPSNVMYGILSASPAVPSYNADGSFARFQGRDNPLAWLLAPTNDKFDNKVNVNAFAEYMITDELTFKSQCRNETITALKKALTSPRPRGRRESKGPCDRERQRSVQKPGRRVFYLYQNIWTTIP